MSTFIDSELPRYTDVVLAVQLSRGWHSRITRASGCRRHTLRRIANDPTYDPVVSEVEKIRAWFLEHGIPKVHPRSRLAASEQPGA